METATFKRNYLDCVVYDPVLENGTSIDLISKAMQRW